MVNQRDTVVAFEPAPRRLEHDLREIYSHRVDAWRGRAEVSDQPAVTCPEIEDSLDASRDDLEEDALAFDATRELIGLLQVLRNSVGIPPLGCHRASISGASGVVHDPVSTARGASKDFGI